MIYNPNPKIQMPKNSIQHSKNSKIQKPRLSWEILLGFLCFWAFGFSREMLKLAKKRQKPKKVTHKSAKNAKPHKNLQTKTKCKQRQQKVEQTKKHKKETRKTQTCLLSVHWDAFTVQNVLDVHKARKFAMTTSVCGRVCRFQNM